MKLFTLITALILCSFSWICVSVSESQTVEVPAGEEVTLMSTNLSTYSAMTYWFRLVKRTKPICISVMYSADGEATNCEGFPNGKFKMSSNVSTVFLQIKQVNPSDSGLYFCGFYTSGHPIFNAIPLNVKGSGEPHDDVVNYEDFFHCADYQTFEESDNKIAKLASGILGAVTGVLIMIIVGLAFKVRKLQTAASEEQNPQQRENLDSDELKDAAQSLYSTIRYRRTASKRDVETHDVYAASR